MPINYAGQSGTAVNVDYAGLPAGTQAVFHNASTGLETPSASDALVGGGAGSASIPFPAGLSPAGYVLIGKLDDEWVAQTIEFYYSGDTPTELPP